MSLFWEEAAYTGSLSPEREFTDHSNGCTKLQFGEPVRFYGVTNRSMCQRLPAIAGVA